MSASTTRHGPAPGGSVARNAFHLVLGQVVTTALAIVFSATLGRRLGAADFGLYFLVTTTVTFAYVVVEWGQVQFVVRELARQPERSGDLLGTTLAWRAAGAAPLAGLTVLVAWGLGYDVRTLGLLALLMLATLPFFLSQAYGLVFRARERMDLDAQVQVAFKAAALPLAIGALALGGGVAGVILAQGAAGLLALGLAWLRSRALHLPPLRVARPAWRELLLGGLPILAIGLAVTVQPYIDVLVLTALVPPAPVGWYGAARNILGTLVAPATILGTASFPRLSRAAADPAQFGLELRSALRTLLGIGALAGVGTYLFAGLAVETIYGERGFGPTADILRVSSPSLYLVCIDVLLASALVALGRPKALAAFKALNVAVCTGASFLLIPWAQARYGNGGIGLVLAFGLSEVMMFAAALRLLPRGTVQGWFAADVARSLAASALTLGLFLVLPPLPPLLGVPLCILAFGAAAAAFGLVTWAELRALADALLRRRAAAPVPPPPAR
ncbi:MAG: oligosaccharide flippase family protein [Anaeromyxobacter sp.]|nr:oligosaccharide flippase family protein [Anaeromyxobacter sp.]